MRQPSSTHTHSLVRRLRSRQAMCPMSLDDRTGSALPSLTKQIKRSQVQGLGMSHPSLHSARREALPSITQSSRMARNLMDRGFQHEDQLRMQRFVQASTAKPSTFTLHVSPKSERKSGTRADASFSKPEHCRCPRSHPKKTPCKVRRHSNTTPVEGKLWAKPEEKLANCGIMLILDRYEQVIFGIPSRKCCFHGTHDMFGCVQVVIV